MKISIITATHNSAKTIDSAITSVISQTYPNIEYIIVDGNSTDGCYEKILQYKDSINTIIHEKDNGIYDALNKGIKNATGDFVGFLHADDFFADNKVISKLAEKLNKTGADAIYGDLQYIDKNNPDKIFRNWKSGEFNSKKLRFGWMPPHPTFFLRRKLYMNHGLYDCSFKISSDYDLILRMLALHKVKSAYLPQVITKMRTGGASNKSLKNIIQKSKEDYKAIKKNKFGNIFTLIFKNLRKLGQFFS